LVRRTIVRKNRYFDSVFLMQIARRIAGRPGIRDASALVATEANRKILSGMGYGDDGQDAEFAAAGPNDLMIALEGEEDAVDAIVSGAESWLSGGAGASSETDSAGRHARSIAEAVAVQPASNVAVISVPGEHAAREARAALHEGLNVFVFSSNVCVEDERSLKAEASQRGLIVMGPDCGTTYLAGAGIGFANAVRRGPIGIVGGTGTGMQEFSCLVHQAGSGISNGIGTGSRDLSDAVGGISTMTGIDALEADPATEVIAVIAKPPGTSATARLTQRLMRCTKPVVLCLLGAQPGSLNAITRGAGKGGNVRLASTLDEAAALALAQVGATKRSFLCGGDGSLREMASTYTGKMRPEQRHIRGLFAGGTLCYQSQAIFLASGLVVHSNSPLPGMLELPDPWRSRESSFIDMGAEIFVEGRPHPMIDATLRARRVEQEGDDPTVALILLDFILGAISSRDPVGDLLHAIGNAQQAERRRGGQLCVVASVCGTDGDVQGLEAQKHALVEAGVLVLHSNARAAAFCREVMLLLAARNRSD
jgi:succinyl-CoA synthetase alpha subunit